MTGEKWNRVVLFATFAVLVTLGLITVVIDPFFHYHGPVSVLQYPLDDERYQNDGLVKHFEYDAIITGSSMCENFKTSQFDALWGTNSIKVCFAGGSYKEIDENLRNALETNSNVKTVLRSIDYSSLLNDKDDMLDIGVERPTYLYDENVFNDVSYLLNKQVLLEKDTNVLVYTFLQHRLTTSFDEYSNWSDGFEYGYEAIFENYHRNENDEPVMEFTEEDRQVVLDNIRQNITATVEEYPEVTFYLFFTPYSICYWDMLDNQGKLERRIDAEKCAIEELLKYENVRLYSFSTNYDMVCDLGNYKDQAHFGEWINSKILSWIYYGEYELTYENYEAYIEEQRHFYTNYDYLSLYK